MMIKHTLARLRALALLMLLAMGSGAQAASVQLTVVTSGFGPAASPWVQVTVSGVVVFDGRTSGRTIAVTTTGSVSVRLRELEGYQEFVGWGGVCAGVLASQPCEFGAGLDQNYVVGIGVRNRSGTLRFTSSSTSIGVPAPDRFGLSILSAPDGALGDLVADTRPSATPLRLLAGTYAMEVATPSSLGCVMAPVAPRIAPVVGDGAETVIPVAFRAVDCLVNAEVLPGETRGSITSAPAGIDCPLGVPDPRSRSACQAFFPFGSTVTLRAVPQPGHVFGGWSVGCSWALDVLCKTTAQASGSAKTPRFAVAAAGSADLAILDTDFAVADAGGGRVRVSLTLRNRGPDAATAVRAEMGPTGAGSFTELPPIVSDGGECNSSSICRWTLPDVPAGQSRVVSFTAASTRTDFALRGCTLSTTPDADNANNCADGVAKVGGVPPVVQGPVTVTAGPLPPVDRGVLKGETHVPVLRFTARPPDPATSAHALVGVVLQVSGSGDDARDILAVTLYPDLNGNGLVDADERAQPVASGRFDGNDGRARLDFLPSPLGAGRSYLVALDINATLAAAPVPAGGRPASPWRDGVEAVLAASAAALLVLASAASAARGRRRAGEAGGAVAMALLAVGCGGGGTGGDSGGGVPILIPPVERSYRVQLVEAMANNGTINVPATGTPLAGAEIRVVK